MNRAQFWQNFIMGDELDIAGRFIYNGLRTFHEIDMLHHEDEIFEVLYNLSVGLERLFKVAVVLSDWEESVVQRDFEKDLITHNHLDLLNRLRRRHTIQFAACHNSFLQMLTKFYKTNRYGRYDLGAMVAVGREKSAFLEYVSKYLDTSMGGHLKVDTWENKTKTKERIMVFQSLADGKTSLD